MKCPICKFTTHVKLKDIKSYYSLNKFQIRKCSNCKVSFTNTKKVLDQKNLYKNIYDYSIHDITKREKLWRIKNTYSKVSKEINLSSKSKILDIGCMQGFFLNYLRKKYNCKVLGVETEDYYLQKKNSDIEIIKSDLYKFANKAKNKNQFDLIIMSHSLEHFPEPVSVLKCLKKLLKKRGKCLIIIPNINSHFSVFSKGFWGWLQPAAHFFHFSQTSLSNIFKITKFDYKLISKNGGDTLLFVLTFINMIKVNYYTTGVSKNSWLRNFFISIFSNTFKYVYYFGNDELVYLIEKK